MKAPKTQIAVTLYSLRDYCKTKEALDETLGKLKNIGYEAVQVSGIGPISPEEVKGLLDKHGLFCVATHENLKDLTENTEAVIKKLKTLECPFTALGWPGDYFNKEGISFLIQALQKAGKALSQAGIRFGYHNHSQEFEKFTGKTMFSELMSGTNPRYVLSEMDVHWVQHGGCNPAKLILGLKKRIYVIHFKDYTVIQGKPHVCEIGEGNMDFPAIVKACKKAGVRWYVVEQDDPVPGRDMFDSARISFDNMRKLGLR